MRSAPIDVLLADDSTIVREGVRALLGNYEDIRVVGMASDLDSLITLAEEIAPHVVVTDIRMPPMFTTEGIEAAHQIRNASPATGIVILSQYDDPDYAMALLSDGAEGYAYVLKDRVAVGDQLANAIREVAIGRAWLDPQVIGGLLTPVSESAPLSASDEELLRDIAHGRSTKAIAAARGDDASIVAERIDRLFLKLAREAGAGTAGALDRLRTLHVAVVDGRKLQESLTRLLPAGVADVVARKECRPGWSELVEVTVLMGDVRGFSAIAEELEPCVVALMLGEHRARMGTVVSEAGGTVMDFAGDSVMAVFGAPVPLTDHVERALGAAREMQTSQAALNAEWSVRGLPPFNIGIGLSTGTVAEAVTGGEDRMTYSVIGDVVNLAQRLQQLAGPGEVTLTGSAYPSTVNLSDAEDLGEIKVKGKTNPVRVRRITTGSVSGKSLEQ